MWVVASLKGLVAKASAMPETSRGPWTPLYRSNKVLRYYYDRHAVPYILFVVLTPYYIDEYRFFSLLKCNIQYILILIFPP